MHRNNTHSISSTSKSENKMDGGILVDVIILNSPAIFKLLTSKDESLLISRNTLLVMNLILQAFNAVLGAAVQSDGLASQSFNKELHFECFVIFKCC